MENLEVSKKEFDKKKNALKNIGKGISTDYDIDKFETSDGWLISRDHKVTGAEMNDFVVVIQSIFNEMGKNDAKLLKEFQTVYDTFDSLDKEYINGIVGNVKTIEKLTDDIKKKGELNAASIKELLEGIVDTQKSLEEEIQKREEISDELLRQAKKDEEHDDLLAASKKKDEEHDNALRKRAEKDIEHDNALKVRAEKDEEHDRRIDELERRIGELESMAKLNSRRYTLVKLLAIIAAVVSIVSVIISMS